jgi:hypothetical protein
MLKPKRREFEANAVLIVVARISILKTVSALYTGNLDAVRYHIDPSDTLELVTGLFVFFPLAYLIIFLFRAGLHRESTSPQVVFNSSDTDLLVCLSHLISSWTPLWDIACLPNTDSASRWTNGCSEYTAMGLSYTQSAAWPAAMSVLFICSADAPTQCAPVTFTQQKLDLKQQFKSFAFGLVRVSSTVM